MEKLEYTQLLPRLEQDKLLYLNELTMLRAAAENTSVFYDRGADVYFMVVESPYGAQVTQIGVNEGALLRFLDAQAYAGEIFIPAPQEVQFERFEVKQIYKSFAATGGNTVEEAPVRGVEVYADRHTEMIGRFQQPEEKNKLSLAMAVEHFTQDSDGRTYLAVEDEEIAGYLACSRETDTIWDVVYIYVLEKYRNRGIGERLARYFTWDRLRDGAVAYYSGVTNPASERVAIKSGLSLCRVTHVVSRSEVK